MKFNGTFPLSFIAFDTETTGLSRNDCVIEIAAVKVIDEKIVDEFKSFVCPTAPINPRAEAVHHISEDMVKDAPDLPSVLAEFIRFSQGLPLVAHNAPFDVRFLAEEATNQGFPIADCTLDCLAVSRSFLPHLESHKLDDLWCHYPSPCNPTAPTTLFGIRKPTHRALDDARALAHVWVELSKEPVNRATHPIFTVATQPKKKQNHSGFSPKKLSAPSCPFDTTHPLYGKVIVFTGNLSLQRKVAAQMASDVGAIVRTSVSRNTDFLIVGGQNLVAVGADGLSNKETLAMDLNNSGETEIQIIDESTFKELLSNNYPITISDTKAVHTSCKAEFAEYTSVLPAFHTVLDAWNISYEDLIFEALSGYSSVFFRSFLVFRIKMRGKKPYISIPTAMEDLIPTYIPTFKTKSEKDFVRIALNNTGILPLAELLTSFLTETIKRYPKEFDCCAHYMECSDCKQCVHPFPELALGCGYKRILISGRIFYGANQNID